MVGVKHRVFLLMVISLFAILVPVQAQNEDTAVAIAPVPCEAPGHLTMWVWDENWKTIIDAAINEWKETYCSGAEVDLVQQPWEEYWPLLEESAASGDLPDVFNMSQDRFYFYANSDNLLDLQPYWDSANIDTTTWGTGLVDPYRWGNEGDLYAGPVNWDTVALYYNKELFDAAGLDYPTADWTWDDFADAAAALTDPDNDVYGAAVYSQYQTGYANWIAATDTIPVVDHERTRCTLTEPGSLEALNFLKTLYDEGLMPSVTTMEGSNANDAFAFWEAGRVAMVSAGSWKLPDALKDTTFDWDVVQLPRNPETGSSRPILHSVGYVASATTEQPDLAANLIIYLVSDEGQQFFANTSGVAPSNPALQDDWIASFGDTNKNIQTFVDALPDTQGVTPFAEIWDTMDQELVLNLFDSDMSVDEATQRACDIINSKLPES
jgi:multiple sugar transport system substrate-binding protein